MKKCLACGETYPSGKNCCLACGTKPVNQDGFPAYAPGIIEDGDGFKAAYFAELALLEEGHFWFRARNRLILWALGKYCTTFKSLLEIGCGTGYVLSGIAKAYPEALLYGSDIFTAGLTFAGARQPSISFMQMDARRVPFIDEFDVVGAFDVLEHIEEDEKVLAQMHDALKPRGVMLLTVPQHDWLWSALDEYACHVRRYSAQELFDKVRAAGFWIERSTSFVTYLLPIMFASRLLKKGDPVNRNDSKAELRISPLLNRLLEMVMVIDVSVIRGGFNFPIGGSRLMIARKK